MAIIPREGSYGVRVSRGKGLTKWGGTFRWDKYGGKRGALRAAEERELQLRKELERGRVHDETCDSFAKRWTTDYVVVKHGPTRGRRKDPKTLETYVHDLRPFVEKFRGVRLSDVDRSAARSFATAHPRSATVARNLFSDAIEDKLVDANPFQGLRMELASGRSRYAAITVEELEALADQALMHGEYGPSFRAYILFTAYVGNRLAEGLALEHRDVRLEDREVDLRVTKFDKPRTVVLLPEAVEAYRSHSRRALRHSRVWMGKRGDPLTKSNHQVLWGPVRDAWWLTLSEERRAELVDFDFHSLRHFCAHHFYVTLNFGSELAAFQLGHSDPSLVEKRYGKPFQGALDRLKRGANVPKVVPMRVANESQG